MARYAASMRQALFGLAAFLLSSSSLAAGLTVGVVPSTLKVRPADLPQLASSASIMAARNEFEAFQIVLEAGSTDVTNVAAKVSTPLTGTGGVIPQADVVLYAERYYSVGAPSNDEGAAGLWPDPLVPDVDPFYAEKRNAFPLTVVANTSRVVWVDVLVPQTQAAGDYSGAIEIDVSGAPTATVPVALHVGNFTLPSTATLASAFGMGWNTPPLVHCGGAFPYCNGDLDKSNAIRALYLRAALDDRISISVTDFQPPFGSDQAPFEKHVLPLIQGTGPTRLPGAKITSVELDGATTDYASWITYAKQSQFFDRLFAYPVDEPNQNAGQWSTFTSDSDALHAVDPTARIILTTSIQDAQQFGADGKIDIMCPVLDEMWGRPSSGQYAGDQRSKYDAWLGASTQRKLFMYQSCDQHGCGACGDPSPGVEYTGWPERVIDSTGVQDRAFEWWSFLEGTSGELYFETTYQLATAWDVDGQCAFSGSGDGTLFYPGLPSVIGGADDIPIDSIRMKLIREGMEDYEYLVMASKLDASKVRQIALALFPTPYQCNQPASALESARAQLFAMLDVTTNPPADGGPVGDGGPTTGGANGGCACRAGEPGSSSRVALGATIGLFVLAIRRRRRPA
jgi:MYXO-CTERM domain-containing protein